MKVLESLLNMTKDVSEPVAKDAGRAIINLIADLEGAELLMKTFPSTQDVNNFFHFNPTSVQNILCLYHFRIGVLYRLP